MFKCMGIFLPKTKHGQKLYVKKYGTIILCDLWCIRCFANKVTAIMEKKLKNVGSTTLKSGYIGVGFKYQNKHAYVTV